MTMSASAATANHNDPLDANFVATGILGGGNFGTTVWLAHKRESKRPVAVKCTVLVSQNDNDIFNHSSSSYSLLQPGDDHVTAAVDPSLKEAFDHESAVLRRLHSSNFKKDQDGRDLFIIYMEESFLAVNNKIACIVLQYAPGGTLSEWLVAQQQQQQQTFITERRIAWFAAQLAQALAYCHERGVAHMDVKSQNVLIGSNGKLLLTDFGNAVVFRRDTTTHGAAFVHENPISGFTEVFAAPELLKAYHRSMNQENHNDDDDEAFVNLNQNEDPFQGLDLEKIDAFAMGCILYELVCGQKLVHLSGTQDDPTIGQAVLERGVEAVLQLPCVSLPWLPPQSSSQQDETDVFSNALQNLFTSWLSQGPSSQEGVGGPLQPIPPGYSNALKHLLMSCLNPDPAQRWSPSHLQQPLLGRDPLSPLTTSTWLPAAHPLVEGDPVTVDNVQLGLLVQRHAAHWTDGDVDGGPGSIGVVVELDVDAGFCFVAWPSLQQQRPAADGPPDAQFCRIGDSGKYELQVGPVAILPDFVTGSPSRPRMSGRVTMAEMKNDSAVCNGPFKFGQKISYHAIVMAVLEKEGLLLVAPLFKRTIHAHPLPQSPARPNPIMPPLEPSLPPSVWSIGATPTAVSYDLVTDDQLRNDLVRRFMDDSSFCVAVESIYAIESVPLWNDFARAREQVKYENWGLSNEQRLFLHSQKDVTPEMLQNQTTCAHFFREQFHDENLVFSHSAKQAAERSATTSTGSKQIILCRVVMGRENQQSSRSGAEETDIERNFHSKWRDSNIHVANPSQVYPEFIFTFKHRRRTVRARRIATSSSGTVAAYPGATMKAATYPGETTSQRPAAPREIPLSPDSQECIICMERAASCVMVPCGHVCLCDGCSNDEGLNRIQRQCPICRAFVQQAVRIYGGRVVT